MNPIPLFQVICRESKFNHYTRLVVTNEALLFHSRPVKTMEAFAAAWEKEDILTSRCAIPFDKIQHIVSEKDYPRIVIRDTNDFYCMSEIRLNNVAERDRLYALLVQTGKFRILERRRTSKAAVKLFIAALLFFIIVFLTATALGIITHLSVIPIFLLIWTIAGGLYAWNTYKNPVQEYHLVRTQPF